MRWIWWFCLPLAHKHWRRDLRWTLPHKCRLAHATLTSSISASFSFFLHYLCLFLHIWTCSQNGYFSTHWGRGEWGKKSMACEFIKQFECDYVNELCLIHATVWTSGVHAGCDKLHSLAAVYVCGRRLWLLNHLIVWEWLHLNSSHRPPKLTVFYKTRGNERGNVQFLAFLPNCCCDFEMEIGSLWLEVAVHSQCAPDRDKEGELAEKMHFSNLHFHSRWHTHTLVQSFRTQFKQHISTVSSNGAFCQNDVCPIYHVLDFWLDWILDIGYSMFSFCQ